VNQINIGFRCVLLGEHDNEIVAVDLKPFHPFARCLNGADDAFHLSQVRKRSSGHLRFPFVTSYYL